MAIIPRPDVQAFASRLQAAMRLGLGRPQKSNGRRGQWTTWEFAAACNVTPQTISNWRQARNFPNTVGFLAAHHALSANNPNNDELLQISEFESSYWRADRGTTLRDEDSTDILSPTDVLPKQTAGPHFAVSDLGKIEHSPPTEIDQNNNNIRRISTLRPLIIEDIDKLLNSIGGRTNAHADLAANLTRYKYSIISTIDSIDWGLVWGLGVRLEEAAIAAERQIGDRMMPALEDADVTSLNAIRSLHSQMVLASAEGRELQQQADEYRMSKKERSAFMQEARILVDSLKLDTEVIDVSAADILQEAIKVIKDEKHQDRTTTFGIATIKHTAIVIIGAAVIAGPATLVGGVGGTILSMGVWEAMKKSPIYAAATASLGQAFNDALRSGGEKTQEALMRLSPFKNFVINNENSLRHISKSTPQLSWMHEYINYIVGKFSPPINDIN